MRQKMNCSIVLLAQLCVFAGPAALLVDARYTSSVAAAADSPLAVGAGRYEFDLDGLSLEVFTYKPKGYDGKRMILVLHGVNRNADEYRDHAQTMGERFNALIVAPRFDAERFPTSKYQFGGILTRDRQPVPVEHWTYNLIPQLAHKIRHVEQRPDLPYWIIGHSAGGQFVARMAAFADTGAERLIAANPGSHLYPSRDLPFGYGFAELPSELAGDATLKRYLAAPLTLYLGTADNAPDRYFDRSESAMKQGGGRWQRGQACYRLAQQVAADAGWPCNWRLVEAADVPHDHQRMFEHPQCAAALFGDSAKATLVQTILQRIDSQNLQSTAEEEMRRTNTPGAAIGIVVGDQLVYAKGLGLANVESQQPVTSDMLFRLGSTTKMFTAAVVVALAEEGLLRLDEPIGNHLTQLDPSIGRLTPHQLLTHTAGLTDESVMSGLHDDSALAESIRAMDSSWLFAEPGEIFSYANPGYWIAGLLGETLCGAAYADVLEQRIFQPAGMLRSTLRPTLAMTWPMALGHEVRGGKPGIIRPQADNTATWPAGQIYSSVHDLARWTALLMNSGRLEDQQVLAQPIVDRMMTTHVPQHDGTSHYGYGLSISQMQGVKISQHGGSRSGYGSTIRMAPDHRLAVIVLTNRSGSSLPETAAKALQLALGLDTKTETESVAPQATPLSGQEMQQLAGVYSNHRRTIELQLRGEQLLMVGGDSGNSAIVRLDTNRIGVLRDGENGGAADPQTTFVPVPDTAGNVAFIYAGSRAYKKQPVAGNKGDDSRYRQPPAAITDILNAPPTPLVSLSPARDFLLLVERSSYPPISDLAARMLRLAGLRINPITNGPHLATRYTGLILQAIEDGSQRRIDFSGDVNIGFPSWSPDGKRLAFPMTADRAIHLWVIDVSDASVRRMEGITLNSAFGAPIQWMPDSRTLLVKTIPDDRGQPPQLRAVPLGPTVEESSGRSGPVRTYQDLLQNSHDEELFEYYCSAQLALVDVNQGITTRVGNAGLFASVEASPDGKHLLVERTHGPYSYLLPASRFPTDIEVWDLAGKVEFTLARLPLQDRVPIDGVPTGPRSVHWQPTEAAALIWTEALDDGDPRKIVPHRDRLLKLSAPFSRAPTELVQIEERFSGISWGERDGLAFVRDYHRDRRWSRTFRCNINSDTPALQLVWERSINDRYADPGSPIMRQLASGHSVMWQNADAIFLDGNGATPQGDRPFLDRFDLATGTSERLFACDDSSYESVVALLSDDGAQFITRHETTDDAPNYFVRTGEGTRRKLTDFSDPMPQLRKVTKQLVTYDRDDGVQLSFTLYLPPDHQPGQQLPTIVWAYPREFNDPATAGQVSGSTNRFTTISGTSHLFLLTQGYAVLDAATMPVVGDPDVANDTYVEQIVASAQAAIDKAVELGVTDRRRVGVGGHSYGAFMTANLLAHCDLFRAGVARSGAYNRTLTPFGFQNERRTFWEAPDIYFKMSPFMVADKIDEPILLIHGEADNNSGTFPIQSERLYQAIRGHGGTVRYVTLPHESHGYAARESVEHTLWEMLNWFDRHVKAAAGSEVSAER